MGHLVVAAVTVVVASGWWVAAVELTPAALRPFIGGSTNNSAVQLLLGYDGLQRILGMFGFDGAAAGGPASTAAAACSVARPACCACSIRSSAARSAGCCRRPSLASLSA